MLLNIEDETCALDFDLACTARLLFFDLDREKRLAEASIMNHMAEVMGEKVNLNFDRTRAEMWE